MAAKVKQYLQRKNIKGLSAADEELVGKCIVKFEALDKDKNGSLCKDEIKGIIAGSNMTVDVVMKTMDLDADGKVSLDEFIFGVVFSKVDGLYRPIFNSFDKNGDGTLDCGELLKVMEGKGYKKADIQKFIAEHDLNKDGKLSYDEFINIFFSMQKKL